MVQTMCLRTGVLRVSGGVAWGEFHIPITVCISKVKSGGDGKGAKVEKGGKNEVGRIYMIKLGNEEKGSGKEKRIERRI